MLINGWDEGDLKKGLHWSVIGKRGECEKEVELESWISIEMKYMRMIRKGFADKDCGCELLEELGNDFTKRL